MGVKLGQARVTSQCPVHSNGETPSDFRNNAKRRQPALNGGRPSSCFYGGTGRPPLHGSIIWIERRAAAA
jgi:hypothetical protein